MNKKIKIRIKISMVIFYLYSLIYIIDLKEKQLKLK